MKMLTTKYAQVSLFTEDGAVFLGVAKVTKRIVDSFRFEPSDIRKLARFLLQAADVAEGKPMPTGALVFIPIETGAADLPNLD